jgi:uracil-DNA glycosylase
MPEVRAKLLKTPTLRALPPLPKADRPLPAWLIPKRDLLAMGAQCHTCPLAKMRAVRSQQHSGAQSPALALVGEAPGRREVMTGQVFVGQSGKLLNYALGQAGIPRRQLAVLNAIACGPIPSDADVLKRAAMVACRPRLLAELRALRPKVLLAVGSYALKALAPEDTSGVTAVRGALLSLAPDVASEAETRETPILHTRAIRLETPIPAKRAEGDETPNHHERAEEYVTPNMQERAKEEETPISSTRADGKETPNLLTRALAPETDSEDSTHSAYAVSIEAFAGAAVTETPMAEKRADSVKTPIPAKRAVADETPSSEKRAIGVETPISRKRATQEKTPKEAARAAITRAKWQPALFSTFHPAHISRGGDGEKDSPDGDSGSAVDLLYYFFLFDLAKAWRYANGTAHQWSVTADLFVDVGGELYRVAAGGVAASLDRPAKEHELYAALSRAYEDAKKEGALSCDVETDSKDSLGANLTSIAFGTSEYGVSATWACWRMFPRVWALLKQIFADRRLRWNWQNGIYDRVVLRRHGLPVTGHSEDTLLMHHAAFPGLPHSLDQMATQFYVTMPWKNEFRTGTKDTPSLVWYNVQDVILTARLRLALPKHIEAIRTARVYEADRQQNIIATRMREVGVPIDEQERQRHLMVQTARLEYMRVSLASDFTAIEESWRQALARMLAETQRKKDPDSYMARVQLRYEEIAERKKKPTDIGLFKPKAKKDLVALFYVLQIPITAYTKKGAPITDKKAMEAAGARHPLMRKLIHLREAQHLIATYIELPVRDDGRMHPDWKTNKITGRWSAGKSQNWPSNVAGWPPEQDANGNFVVLKNGNLKVPRENLRSIVAAPTAEELIALARRDLRAVNPRVLKRALAGKGRVLVGADEDQVELRIIAFLSGDQFLLDIFNAGKDPHSAFAGDIIFPKHFPQLGQQVKEAGFNPKEPGDIEDAIVAIAGEDDISKARRAKLRDVHTAAKQWKRLRELAKRFEYAFVYEAMPVTVWESLVKDFPEVTLTDVEEAFEKMRAALTGVVAWWHSQETYARLNREVREQILGRVRLFPLGNFNKNVAINYPVQAHNAGLMARAHFRFVAFTQPELLDFERLYKFNLLDPAWIRMMRARGFRPDMWHAPVETVLQVHDSLVAECDEDDGDKVGELLEASLDQEDADPKRGIRMRYTAKAAKNRRWSRA